ncbi:UDP-3-O-[3-hydroxymyristoyl] glucosamine N-acyltransferase [Methylophilus rhizosphaerae]|uniref:UDP-3-O-acylglucosamine N-acyltransferase n=1 Tax=Methylophilus rhizosphaerae TaxID=492660 RepID=A0A1G8ZLB2_9PROT|nr:UDP-3-O-(3-hydroxymyristoyl)glucosamine N-acyltransferase [Methylophilus rhizosphaerae]SDK15828.1 UDP-3-O-[3-hydroxymyristoyl] glucosamine N-acyltransferase [Methylophilus rhizosphaerae]
MTQLFTLHEITASLGGEVDAGNTDAATQVSRLSSLAQAQAGSIAFFNDTKYTQSLQATLASAVILRPEHRHLTALPCILTDNPYAYFAKLSALLNPPRQYANHVHATAVIGYETPLPPELTIDAMATVGDRVTLGNGVRIGAGCVIEDDVTIGAHTILEPRAVVKHGSVIGEHCHLFSGCIIGNDGFGYAEEQGQWVKIPQIGRVVIGHHVDIGANTTVDRGALDDTIIEDGVKLDNLIQVAHNVRIGAHTVIAGCAGIAGSAVIGQHCKIGGAAMILGHLHIVDGVTISPGSMIMRSIQQPGTYTALMPFQKHEDWLRTAANIRHLEQNSLKLKLLEQAINSIKKHTED